MKFFDPVILLTSEYNGISKGSRGYFIESVSDRVCTVSFNEWYRSLILNQKNDIILQRLNTLNGVFY